MSGHLHLHRVITWGHPNATYTSNEQSKVAKIYYIPPKFEEFRHVMIQKACSDKYNIIKNEGNLHYQDDDRDWVPIESQAEYDEAVKYIRHAKSPVSLRISCKIDDRNPRTSGTLSHASEIKRQLKKIEKELAKSSVKTAAAETSGRHSTTVAANVAKECPHRSSEKLKIRGSGGPPTWFDKYMQKFKHEILSEVAVMLNHQQQHITTQSKKSSRSRESSVVQTQAPSMDSSVTVPKTLEALATASSTSEALTSPKILEAVPVIDHKCHKNPKRSTKCHEKKLKKLNSKLENLEMKRARLLEWSRKRQDQTPLIPPATTATTLMDAAVLETGDPNIAEKCHVGHNAFFTKKWKVLNTGTAAWDDKTEVRLAWLTQGLKPQESFVSCPKLEPGQEGEIAITFQAPDFAGLFESYWHFYHGDERFGQWMGCAAIVDPKQNETLEEACDANNLKTIEIKEGSTKQVQIPITKEVKMSASTESGASEATSTSQEEGEEDRGEYESDNEEDNNAVSHSENDNQFSSDSDDSDDSESFVHVPMPLCYQYHTMPLFNIPPGDEDISVAPEGGEEKEENCVTPPTTPREPDSEEDEFVEASGTGNHAEPSTSGTAPHLSQQSDHQYDSPAVQILPDNIVSGAINVANRALIATEAIMKSIQNTTSSFNIPPRGEAPLTPQSSEPNTPVSRSPGILPGVPVFPAVPVFPSDRRPSPPIVIPEPHTTTPELTMLYDMGFKDVAINKQLLAKHKNDMSQVISELVGADPTSQ